MGTLRERIWLWGMKVNILQSLGHYAFRDPSTMTVEDAIQKSGVSNVLIAGNLEIEQATLDAMPSARRIIAKWALHRGEPGKGNLLDLERCLQRLRAAKELAARDPRIDAFLVDDFSTGTIDAGITPAHLAQFQRVNAAEFPHLPFMGTIYTMSLDRPEMPGVLPFFASYMTPLWHAAEIDGLEADIDRLAAMSGGKPQLVCIYLYDFGNAELLSYELMRRQLDVVESLLRQDKVIGAVILGTCMMDLDWEANRCFYDWLDERGDQPL